MILNRWLATVILSTLLMLLAVTASAAVTERDVATLPVKGLSAINSEGAVFFISENGRFVIKGELYDLWYKKRITDFEEMRTLATYIDLAKMKLEIAALNSVSVGNRSQKKVVIFINHHCPHCQSLIQQAKKLDTDYCFQWILAAGANPADPHTIQNVVCADLPAQALLTVVNNSIATLPDAKPCGAQKAVLTQLTMQLMGIDQVPFLIAPDGRFHSGVPKNLKAWLEGKP